VDALAVARAVVKDGIEQFPVAFLDERAMEIRLLLDHRNDLVAERTRTVNRVRRHLLELCPEVEASLKRKALNQPRTLDRVDRQLRNLSAGARTRVARDQLAHLRQLNRRIDALQRELAELVVERRPELPAEQGCGPPNRGDSERPTPPATSDSAPRPRSRCSAVPPRSRASQGSGPGTGSTAAVTGSSTTRCTSSP